MFRPRRKTASKAIAPKTIAPKKRQVQSLRTLLRVPRDAEVRRPGVGEPNGKMNGGTVADRSSLLEQVVVGTRKEVAQLQAE